MTTRAALAASPHFVYRLYDADGTLLYVGCTTNPEHRLQHHKGSQLWGELIARQDVERARPRRQALEREAEVINAERPRFNVAHNLTPERWTRPSEDAFRFVRERVNLSGRDIMRAFFAGELPLEPTDADVWLWLKKLDTRYHAWPCYRSCRCGHYTSHALQLAEDFREAQWQRDALERRSA